MTILGSAVEEVTVEEVAPLVDDDSVFTALERADLAHRRDPLPGFAARLAAKRAFAAAAGWTEALCRVEIVSDHRGRPSIELRSDAVGVRDLVVRVSLSHDDGIGVAAVVVERPD